MRFKKSIFGKYMGISMTVLTCTLICIGAALLVTASGIYRREKYNGLIEKTGDIATAVKLSYLSEGEVSANELSHVFRSYATASENSYTLYDIGGGVVCCSEPDNCRHNSVSVGTLSAFGREGNLSLGNFDGSFSGPQFIYGVLLTVGNSDYYLISATSAAGYQNFMVAMYTSFGIICVVGVIAGVAAIYFMTKSMIAPLEKMTVAAEKYGQGDFSEKITVSGDNEMSRLAAALNEMSYSLSTADESRKSFVANVSHELRTPMTTIGGFVDGIRDGTIPPEQHDYYLRIISEEVARLTRLVRSMLNISKFESGEMQIKYEDFDIVALAVRTVLLFEKRIEEKGVDVKGLDADPLIIRADQDLIQQVIWNLTENAVKFVNEGGVLTFGFGVSEGNCFISIRNSGEGLSHDEIPRVFDRFYKTDESRGKDKNGVGLGLSIVRSIVKLHQGNIYIKSLKGEYCEFLVTLPLNPTEV